MNKEIAFLENSVSDLYDALGDATDEQTKAELKTAIGAINDKIETLYESAPQASIDLDAGKARREGKLAARDALKRIAAAGGKQALDFALSLPDSMSLDEVERVATRAAATGALSHQSRGTIAALPQPRLPSEQAEQSWLREAREHAESEWAKAMGKPMPVRQLSAEEIALAQSFNSIAAKAAGLTHEEDGRKRFRGDQEDARVYAIGQESARRIWPGR
jgi:hypothetical protein